MLVSNLTASTGCQGRAIYLSWTNPAGATQVKVVRRANDWPYYLDDPSDILYAGAAITSLDDIPGEAWVPLADDTYYYYVVVAHSGPSVPADDVFELGEASRTSGLSIAVMAGKEWIWDKIPKDMKRLDSKPVEEGGGDGDLEKWITQMGCWLNLLRGYNKAILLNADESKSHYEIAKLKNEFWGVTPEESYDFRVVRNFNERAGPLYKIKLTCDSLVEVINIYTGWDAECADLATTAPSGCGGPMLLSTYDGHGTMKIVEGADNVLLH